MKPLNLKLLTLAKDYLPDKLNHDLNNVWGVNPKEVEYQSVASLVSQLETIKGISGRIYRLLDGCFFNFTIPQISNEFDCLWIGEKSIINIELKSDTPKKEDKIRNQLIKNRHFLHPLNKTFELFCFTAATKQCYRLDEEGNLLSTTIDEIAFALERVHEEEIFRGDIETLFSPEIYLVSPFNSTEEFLSRHYFLTSQQEEIKDLILSDIESKAGSGFYGITGGPGSGKTLLIYDIASTLMDKGKKVVIGQSGGINDGQRLLKERGWSIFQTQGLFTFSRLDSDNEWSRAVREADIYIIDEAQRSPHVDMIAEETIKNGRKCIFSIDSKQCLKNEEIEYANELRIRKLVGVGHYFSLRSKIRSNHAIYDFINALFDKGYCINKSIGDNIELSYCSTVSEVLSVFSLLQNRGFKICKFTPNHPAHSRNDYEEWFPTDCPSAHNVIGQEFDYVACLISPNITYKSNKLVSVSEYYYIEDRMLYQIMSRARKGIHVVVFNNPGMMERCLTIKTWTPS